MSDEKQGEKIICPTCGAENLPGTLFCTECGIYLPSGGPLRTEPLPDEQESVTSRRWVQEAAMHTSHLVGITIEVLQSGRRVPLALDEGKELFIGRLDAVHGIFPELDLTNDGGLEHGVSRRHARIYAKNGVCYLEDMDSTNGTFLGDERLTPYLPYELHDGDIITLGTMRLRLRLHRRPA